MIINYFLKLFKVSYNFIIILILFFNSCKLNQSEIDKICDKCPKITKDSIYYKEIKFDTILFLSSQKTNINELTGNCNVLCDSLNKLIDKYIILGKEGIVKNENGIKTIITKNKKGNFVFKSNIDSLKKSITIKVKEKINQKIITKELKIYCKENHFSKFDKFRIKFFNYFVVFLIGFTLTFLIKVLIKYKK